MQRELPPAQQTSGWAVGGLIFAGAIMLTAGIFQAIAGFTAILNDTFFVVGNNYAFKLDVTTWGWIHLVLAIVVAAAGAALLFTRRRWAGVVAIIVAMISAFENFLFLPYYPFWAVLMIALDIWVIWAVTRPGILESR
jgi:hypothetical protein